jgi:hypothetical protein
MYYEREIAEQFKYDLVQLLIQVTKWTKVNGYILHESNLSYLIE